MKIDISPLLDQPERRISDSDEWAPDRIDLDSDSFSVDEPLHVEYTLSNDGGTIHATGTYSGRLTLSCARCLTEYHEPLSGEFEARFLSSKDALREEKEQAEEPVYFGRIRENTVDLGSIVRQDILVQCPMRPLCDEECEGLCPVCGANLNEEDCGHEQESGDPRMARFRELSEELDETGDSSAEE